MTYPELISSCKENYILLDDDIIQKLKIYCLLLQEWNNRMNLTSIVKEEEIIEKHFYDCLLLLSDTDFTNKKVVDIGTGAGFPGMIIALACPNAKVTLVDATSKKFTFLEKVKDELGLNNVTFYAGRAEEMKKQRNSFDIVLARSFAQLNILLEVCLPLAKTHGLVIAMKAKKGEEELKEATTAIKKLSTSLTGQRIHYLHDKEDMRVNLIFTKDKPTLKSYPRSWGEIKKRPL